MRRDACDIISTVIQNKELLEGQKMIAQAPDDKVKIEEYRKTDCRLLPVVVES